MRRYQAAEAIDPAWAWSAYEPSAQTPWNLASAAHLLRRAGFGPTWSELRQAVEGGPQATLERVLAGAPDSESFYADEAERTLKPLLASNNGQNLPAWWLYVMLRSPHPLREKMTLFWHGHFATSSAKVTNVPMMSRQNAILRTHALGSFAELLRTASKDPAMLIWLDSTTNHKSHPNENFAREVMELFALGIGNYTETDIKEAARAFTGWEVRRGEFWFNRNQHDVGVKRVLSAEGAFDGDQVLDVLLAQPAAGRFIARKLVRYFVSDTLVPSDELLEPLAAGYRERGYDTAWLVRTILGSQLFFSPQAVRQKVKSPVEFGVGLIRALEGATNTYSLAEDLRNLGQGVFFPPNVKGWDGGPEWINTATLLGRANLAWAILGGSDPRYGRKLDLPALLARLDAAAPSVAVERLLDLLLSGPVPEATRVQLATIASSTPGDAAAAAARVTHAIATLPEFQLV